MQADRPSSTAGLVASWRALETLLPADRRIVSDPYARGFLGPGRAAAVDAAEKLPPGGLATFLRRIDRYVNAARTFVLARHRAMDELIVGTKGLQQLVLLGAGYDTRSVRLAEQLEGVTVFEVDHPATARRKRELEGAVYGDAPRATTIPVEIDFANESIADKLREAGLEPGKLTVWIWEGVSMYLEESAVRATFDLVQSLSAPGSLLTFDVWAPPQEGLSKVFLREVPMLAMRLIFAEPFVWTPRLSELEPMLREHGLALIEAVPDEELISRYTTRPKRRRLVSSFMAFCVAEVDRA